MKQNTIWNLIFPRRCALCDDLVRGNAMLCKKCNGTIKPLTGAVCQKCGKKVLEEQIYCYDCRTKRHVFDKGLALFEYQDIKESLYRFKYAGRAEYAAFYGYMAYRTHGKTICNMKADALIPVPLHYKKQHKRGYNQSYELAQKISEYTGIPVDNKLVKRKKNTLPMKRLKGIERQNNLKSAFLIMRNDVKLKTIIIIDDIYTTGATMDAVSEVCRQAGAEKIYFLTVAAGNGI